ncbi:hypothetical protein LTR66_002900 [Elasticomyces elasticus]|nr:hypothetical protein LTR66_002900 [Elasticomyces elasticus]
MTLPNQSQSAIGDFNDGPVHPIFRQENFHHRSGLDYNAMLPTLRLATCILEAPATLKFFHTQIFGRRTSLPQTRELEESSSMFKLEFYTRRSRFGKQGLLDAQADSEIRDALRVVADVVRFRLMRNDDEANGIGWASTAPNDWPLDLMPVAEDGRPAFPGTGSWINISPSMHARMLTTYHSSVYWAPSAIFHCAKDFVHELAHAVDMLVLPRGQDAEQFHEDDELAESGHSFEKAVFGGVIEAFETEVLLPGGLLDEYGSPMKLGTRLWPVVKREEWIHGRWEERIPCCGPNVAPYDPAWTACEIHPSWFRKLLDSRLWQEVSTGRLKALHFPGMDSG